jgi:hypothetical protein
MELPRHPIGHFCARCLDQFYFNLFNLSFALDHFASFFCKGKGIILKLGTIHPQITYKKFEIKIHNIISRFFHPLLPKWHLSNAEAKVQSLCRIRQLTPPPNWTFRKIQHFGTSPKCVCIDERISIVASSGTS